MAIKKQKTPTHMKINKYIFIGLIFTAFSFCLDVSPELKIGSDLPKSTVKLLDVSDKKISLSEAKNKNGLLVIFSCNTCPYVKLYEKRIKQLTDNLIKNEVGVVIINSNEAQREDEDSFEEMKNYFKSQQLNCFYVLDNKTEMADVFGATRTPQVFLFNKENKLVYKGAIDDNIKDVNAVKENYLIDAIDATLKNTTPKIQESKSIGCTIKRLE
jgi:thioredoxin-related protein